MVVAESAVCFAECSGGFRTLNNGDITKLTLKEVCVSLLALTLAEYDDVRLFPF